MIGLNLTKVPRSILVVDDEPHLVRAVRMYLELQGFTVFGAQSGEEALEVIRDRLPDLVVLDVMLPGLNGFETLQELRRVSNVPVIMLTSLAHEDQRVQGLTLGRLSGQAVQSERARGAGTGAATAR